MKVVERRAETVRMPGNMDSQIRKNERQRNGEKIKIKVTKRNLISTGLSRRLGVASQVKRWPRRNSLWWACDSSRRGPKSPGDFGTA